jgi:hypothetical protein
MGGGTDGVQSTERRISGGLVGVGVEALKGKKKKTSITKHL